MSVIQKLGKFQTRDFSGWMGLSKKNHLYSALMIEPQRASDVMIQLFAYQNGGNSLLPMLNSLPVKEFQDDSEIVWDVIGTSRRNISLVKATTFDGTAITTGMTVGQNVEPFYLYFAEKYFADGEVIFGNLNEVYQIRIVGDPQDFGTLIRYKVELMGSDGIPGERLQQGEKFSVGFAPVSRELSRKVGDIRFTTPVAMRNEWTTIRLQHKAPGSMMNQKIAVGIPVVKEQNGKIVSTTENSWMHHVDFVFEQQWQEYKTMALAWGASNRNENGEYLNFDKSGEVIRMGDGLFAQLKRGNTHYYSKFSLKYIEDAIYEVRRGKKLTGSKVVMRTGMKGALQFSKAVGAEVSGWTKFDLSGDALGVVKKSSTALHDTSLSAGYMFTEYRSPMGVTLTVEVDPFYDDEVINKMMHPMGGPASSYRYDIMDLGSAESPNIQLTRIKGETEVRSIEPGIRDPFTGRTNIENASNDEDAATIHRMDTFGVIVYDPTRTMSIIPSILQ